MKRGRSFLLEFKVSVAIVIFYDRKKFLHLTEFISQTENENKSQNKTTLKITTTQRTKT